MNNENIAFKAYKKLLKTQAGQNIYELSKNLNELDYLAFKEHNELLVGILEETRSSYGSVSTILENYFKYNPTENKNYKLGKEILKNLKSEKDIKKVLDFFGEDNFIKNYELMKQITINTEGRFFIYNISEKARKDEKLREFLYDVDRFNISWFNLPAPTDKLIIQQCLEKNFNSYRFISLEDRENKDFLLTTLQAFKKDKIDGLVSEHISIQSQLYNFIPNKLKTDKDVCEQLAKLGFPSQIKEAYLHNSVLPLLFEEMFEKQKNKPYSAQEKNLYELSLIPKDIFENYKNVESLLLGLTKYKDYVKKDHASYVVFYKLIKNAAKNNGYVKEAFNRKNSIWNQGNITDSKNSSKDFFHKIFTKSTQEMLEEIKLYIAAEDLKSTLTISNSKNKSKVKI